MKLVNMAMQQTTSCMPPDAHTHTHTHTHTQILNVEADCYWCLCKMLDGIQDNYTYAQPGIQRTLFYVKVRGARGDGC